MIRIDQISKDVSEAGAFNALVGIHAAVSPHTFLTKGGALLEVLSIQGIDPECLEFMKTDSVARRYQGALRVFDERWRLYQYRIKRDRLPVVATPCTNPIVHAAMQSRAAFLNNRTPHLCMHDTYFVVAYEGWQHQKTLRGTLEQFLRGPGEGIRLTFSQAQRANILEKELNAAIVILDHKVRSFALQLPEDLKPRILDKDEAYSFFRSLVNFAPFKQNLPLRDDRFVDFQMCDSELECERDHLRLDDFHVRVLTLKILPTQTSANWLRGLEEITCDFILATEWRQENTDRMRSLIRSKRRHFGQKRTSFLSALGSKDVSPQDKLVDDSAVANVRELGACLEEIDFNDRFFGEFSLTIVLYSKDETQLRRSVEECYKIFSGRDITLTTETYNQLNAYLAILPGNNAYSLRSQWLLDSNYADMSLLFAPAKGDLVNRHLGTEYLAAFETNQRTANFFNLHHNDIGHAVVLGSSGAGKSFLLNLLILSAQKYGGVTCIFDLGGSYEHLTRLLGGAYVPVGIEKQSFTINPYVLPPTPENLQFLFMFVKVLIESGGLRMTNDDDRDLYEQIKNVYAVDPDQRRLLTLANMLKRNLRVALEKWVEGGPYGHVFDNAHDNLTFAQMQVFDFEAMSKVTEVLEPLLFYILHRATALISDPEKLSTCKFFIVDEAWVFLSHPVIKAYIREALKTWRKKNAAMVLATQSSNDLQTSEILPVVVESCPTKIFLANPDMDSRVYREIFHLNETEADLIARLVPKQQFLLKRPDMAKVLNLHVAARDYWLYTSSPQDRQRRNEAFERYGIEQGLEILGRSTR